MLQGKIALVGVGAAVEKHDDGTRTLHLQDGNLELLIPLSADAARKIGTALSAPGIVLAQGDVPRA